MGGNDYFCREEMILKNQSLITMKYSEIHKKLRKAGCYPMGNQQAGHPLWKSPITGKEFATSNHLSEEAAKGTLCNIEKASGVKLK